MKIKTIYTTVTMGVVLDTGQYGGYLIVAASGEVAPAAAAGVDGIAGPPAVHNDRVTNLGTVLGGAGAGAPFSAYAGGAGIDLAGGGVVRNSGVITGGAGGAGGYYGGDGGAGVALSGAVAADNAVYNRGSITGGAGGSGGMVYGAGGHGGAGVALSNGGTVTNHGFITGGAAGAGYYPSQGGAGVALGAAGLVTNWGTITGGANMRARLDGGVGVNLAAGTLFNNGLIAGGLGADAVQFQQGGLLRNVGSITGGTGGGFGVLLDAGGKASNFGRIAGGTGQDGQDPGQPGRAGGYGMLVRGGITLANYGTLAGGAGGNSENAYGGAGGIGLSLETTSTVLNVGVIAGGDSGLGALDGTGGIGVQLQFGISLTNLGTIAGGDGVGDAGAPNDIGRGGAGIYVTGDSKIINHGVITGGASAYGGYGVRLAGTSATLLNTGTIAGGAGATTGGVGVFLDGNIATNEGTIAGGAGYGGVRADAVQFGFYGGTLVVTPGAMFEGAIQGSTYGDSTIVLAGHGGTLSGIGTNVTGITNFVEDARARWTLAGTLTGAGALEMGADARLALTGGSSIATIAFAVAGYGTLTLDQPGLVTSGISGFSIGDKISLEGIQAASFKLSHDTLTLFGATHNVLDTLHFAGPLTPTDLVVFDEGKTTEIVYAGPGHPTLPHDWLPLTPHAGFS